MVKKLISLNILLFATMGLLAQTPADTTKPAPTDTRVVADLLYIYGNALANSNSITGKLTTAFLKGGYIDDATKATTLDRLKTKNRLGLELNYGATYVHFAKKRKGALIGYYLRYNQGLYMAAQYNENAYRLMFYGNAPFAGQTVSISPFRYYLMGQRNLGGGLMLGKNKNTFWLGADFVQATSYTDIQATNTNLTTAVDGTTLQLDGQIDFKQSARPTYNAGYGFALNGQWFTDIKDKIFLNFAVDNLGLAFFNANSQNFSRDTTIQFSGINLNDVLEGDSAWQQIQDSLTDALLPSQKNKVFSTVLPFSIKVTASRYFLPQSQLLLSLILNYRYVPGYIPQAAVQARYKVSKFFSPSLTVMYGGYGGFNTGLGLNFNFGKGYSLSLESLLNEGLIVPKNASGIGFGVRFYKSFLRK